MPSYFGCLRLQQLSQQLEAQTSSHGALFHTCLLSEQAQAADSAYQAIKLKKQTLLIKPSSSNFLRDGEHLPLQIFSGV
jgi:hypothetical protein